ncbi:MAG TPA: phosphomannomutase/phosphoglucomutase [bacterium]|nr:phosphomannomutase/phosphoglucomutase [bacterium]HPO52589.1 phosphomannomutase/phosphoglucomutase [bacterium]
MKPDRVVFREYDIRGIVKTQINNEFAFTLGRAFGTKIKNEGLKNCVVACDNRETSPDLKNHLIDGMMKAGIEVFDAGMIPTPVAYFAQKHYGLDACAMVTASHNPPQFNGFKLVLGETGLHGEQIQQIADIIEKQDFISGSGSTKTIQVEQDYIDFMKERFSFSSKMKIGVDTGNGTTGPFVKKLFSSLGIDFVGLYLESDSSFPHHLPDPVVPENLVDLIKLVKEQKLDAGFGFDGDGDRIGVIGSDGSILWGDQLLIIYGLDILKTKPGSTIVFDVKCTLALEEEIKKAGGIPLMWKTGHSLIKAKLMEEKAVLGGELSGHIYFADQYFGFDDAFYACLRLLRIMDQTGKKPEQLLENKKRYYSSPEIRIEVGEEKKYAIVEELKNFYKQKYNVSEIDGVKVYFPDGWALARVSNTQPAIVLRVEGKDEKSLEEIKKQFLSKVEETIK